MLAPSIALQPFLRLQLLLPSPYSAPLQISESEQKSVIQTAIPREEGIAK